MSDTNRTTPNTGKREKAKGKIKGARKAANDAASRAADAIEQNPMSVFIGGLAVGIIAGALIPRSEREKAALSGVGQRIADTASAAAKAARETGKAQLSGATLSKDSAKGVAQAIFGSALAAAKDASTKPTAPKAARKPRAAKSA